MKKKFFKFRSLFAFTLISLLFVHCGNPEKQVKRSLGIPTAETLLLKKLLEEELNKVTIDFSGINQNLYDVLRYRTETIETRRNLFIPFIKYKKKYISSWKEIPSEKIRITKNSTFQLSLKDALILGSEKVTSDTKIKIKELINSDKKVKNLKYLILSLSSNKSGKIDISEDDLKELRDKKINFDQIYTDFKEDEKVKELLADKTIATDDQVENFKVDK